MAVKILRHFLNYKNLRCIKRYLRNLYNCGIKLSNLKGSGACDTLLAEDSSGKKLCVVKLKNRYAELRSRKANSALESYVYRPPHKRFLREYQILNKLSKYRLSPRPIKATDNYLVEEYVEGPSLMQMLLDSPDRFLEIHITAFTAINRMHKLGVYHGEPSLANMISVSGEVKLIDFEHSLNEKRLTEGQMEAIDFFRLILNTEKTLPFKSIDKYQKLGEFLQKELDVDIVESVKGIIKYPLFRNNIKAKKVLNSINPEHKETITNFKIEKVSLKKDLNNLIDFYSNEQSMHKNKAKKTILTFYKRFPGGFLKVEKNDEIIALVSLGFQKPHSLMYFISKLPFILPSFIFGFLLNYRIIRVFEIANIYVSRQNRNKGVGTRLIGFCENLAKNDLCQKDINLLVREENAPALSFYKKMGYRQCGIVKVANGRKIKMKKDLRKDDIEIAARTKVLKIEKYSNEEFVKEYRKRYTNPIARLRDRVEKTIVLKHVKGDIMEGGVGTGRFTLPLASAGHLVVGLDISKPMLKLVNEKRSQHKIYLIRGDLENLAIKSNSFDSVVSIRVLMHLPQYKLVLKEFFRILKPNGAVVFDIYNKEHITIFRRIKAFLKRGRPATPENPADYLNDISKRDLSNIIESMGGRISKLHNYNMLESNWLIPFKRLYRLSERLLENKLIFKLFHFLELNIFCYLPSWMISRRMVIAVKSNQEEMDHG